MKPTIVFLAIGVIISCCQNKTSAEHTYITHVIERGPAAVTYVIR